MLCCHCATAVLTYTVLKRRVGRESNAAQCVAMRCHATTHTNRTLPYPTVPPRTPVPCRCATGWTAHSPKNLWMARRSRLAGAPHGGRTSGSTRSRESANAVAMPRLASAMQYNDVYHYEGLTNERTTIGLFPSAAVRLPQRLALASAASPVAACRTRVCLYERATAHARRHLALIDPSSWGSLTTKPFQVFTASIGTRRSAQARRVGTAEY